MISLISNKLKSIRFLPIILTLLALLPLPSVLHEWARRIAYEWSGPYTWDTTVYWAVGRAIVNGFVNYRDIMDIKPPGIHLLSAASFWLSDGVWLTNFAQVIALLTIVLASIGSIWLVLPKSLKKKERALWLIFALGFGLLLSLYAAKRSGEVQVESFGAAVGVLYLWGLLWKPATFIGKALRFALLTLALLGSCGFKEPFLFVAIAVACVFLNSAKAWLKDFIYPLVSAIFLGLLALLFTGSLFAYVGQYLRFMLSTHVSRFGSPWLRGLQFIGFKDDANQFSLGFGYLLFLLGIFLIWKSLRLSVAHDERLWIRLFTVIRVGLAIYLPMFAVGLGGEFYNHHHVFAVPALLAWFVWFAKQEALLDGIAKSAWMLLVLSFTCVSALAFVPDDYEGQLRNLQNASIGGKSEAAYVDEVLNRVQVQRYVYLGLNGPQLYGWTKHSPMGPLFIQTPNWMLVPGWGDCFMDSLRTAQLVVEENIGDLGDSTAPAKAYLEQEFTQQPWKRVADIPRGQNVYRIYFRKNAAFE